VATVGPVAVGVMLAFAWNMAVSQPQRAAGDESGFTPQVGLTVQHAAEQAWESATPQARTDDAPSLGPPPGDAPSTISS
jgi:hypothetical protein